MINQIRGLLLERGITFRKGRRHAEACLPGLTATAIVASIGSGAEFQKGRSFAAWLGLVPKQHSTGSRQNLLSISKRGNRYLRRLLVHGARAVLQCRDKQSPALNVWLGQLASRAHANIVAVALANKMARMAWAVLAKSEAYRPPLLVTSAETLVCN